MSKAARKMPEGAVGFDGEGRLTFLGRPVVMVSRRGLALIQSNLDGLLGERATAMAMKRAGLTLGREAARRYRGSGREALEEFLAWLSLAGWFSRARVEEFGEEIVVRVWGSYAEEYPGARGPVCHVVAGLLAGFLREKTGRKLLVREEECVAAGAESCLFRARPV